MQKHSTLIQRKQYPRSGLSDYWPLITVLLPIGLTGCMGVYEGGFECPPGGGVGCKSISEVNHLVNQGELPKRISHLGESSGCERCQEGGSTSPSSLEPQIWYSPTFLEGSI